MSTAKPRSRPFAQIDVFTARAGYGNPVAVVFDADDLDAVAMQRFAAWTNLSETTFVLKPTTTAADFRLRIFTPRQELPFAGHPTVGTSYAVVEARAELGGRNALVLECAAGLLPVRIEGHGAQRRIFVQSPEAGILPSRSGSGTDIAHALGIAPLPDPASCVVDVGPRWLIAQMTDAATVRSLRPDFARVALLTAQHGDAVGVAVFGRERDGDHAIAVRAFCPADGIPEDPVTGSANAAIGAWLHATGGLDALGHRYRASQGREVGRDGTVEVQVDPASGRVMIGGHCVSCIAGHVVVGH
ncbi:MAG: PhzF family phenazine biosynthesis protein [Dokdonella sp.]|uniref:PhzF family phenazine biosynthesis protein n=1 Tax=Dokdonella sp. TaxID=2291710 RepID=UPI003265B4F6